MTTRTPPSDLVTSAVVSRLATAFAAGVPAVITGPVGDLAFLRGEVLPFRDIVALVGASNFDVVLRINAVDPLTVVHDDGGLDRALAAAGLDADVVTREPGRGADPADGARTGDGASEGGTDARADRIRAVNRPAAPPRDPIEVIRALLEQTASKVVVIVEQGDILLQDPSVHDMFDRTRVATMQLALTGRGANSAVLLAGNRSAVPRELTDHDLTFAIELPSPTRADRVALLRQRIALAHGGNDLDDTVRVRTIETLADLTDGELLATVCDMLSFSARAGITVTQARELVERYRSGARADHWSYLAERMTDARAYFSDRLFGQPAAIDQVVAALSGAALGLSMNGQRHGREGQPKGLLLFSGPTGVGKTELAKLVAEFLFGDPEAYVRIDMSTFGEPQDAARLTGAAPGYVGYEQGGELTNAVLRRAALVVLLDEIEKADPAVFDRLLSIVDDGRVTDAQGRLVYFGEAIIIATSNVGGVELLDLLRSQPDVDYETVRDHTEAALRSHFTEIRRPEVFGRLQAGVVAFDFLRSEAVEQIVGAILDKVFFEFGPEVRFDRASIIAHIQQRMRDPDARSLGGRQIRNEVRVLLERVASELVQRGAARAEAVEVQVVDGELQLSLRP